MVAKGPMLAKELRPTNYGEKQLMVAEELK